jgi:hypothetical protein
MEGMLFKSKSNSFDGVRLFCITSNTYKSETLGNGYKKFSIAGKRFINCRTYSQKCIDIYDSIGHRDIVFVEGFLSNKCLKEKNYETMCNVTNIELIMPYKNYQEHIFKIQKIMATPNVIILPDEESDFTPEYDGLDISESDMEF